MVAVWNQFKITEQEVFVQFYINLSVTKYFGIHSWNTCQGIKYLDARIETLEFHTFYIQHHVKHK